MEGAAHAQELHRKFQALNEDVTTALRAQEDALSAVGAKGSAKRDAVRLATRAIDWREDVAALAKHIDGQLQHSRALRAHYTSAQLPVNPDRQRAEDEGARLRRLRSDLRLLHGLRVSMAAAEKEEASSDPVNETSGLQAFLDWSVKREKTGDAAAAVPLAVELFERRREFMRVVAEQVLRDKLQRDADVGSLAVGATGENDERDVLAARDTQLFVMLVQTVVELQDELRSRYSDSNQHQQAEGNPNAEVNAHSESSRDRSPVSSASTLEELQVATQKLRRELAESSAINAKLVLAYSQLEDDLVHLQRKYEDEKRAHISGRTLFLPKLQKLEEAVLTTTSAFHEVKLSVDLVTNMYKSLSQQVTTQQQEEDELKLERDRISQLLAAEIKKVALLSKENERKDKLVGIAMAARHEMARHAKDQEQITAGIREQYTALKVRAQVAEDEANELKQQLGEAYAHTATFGAKLQEATAREQKAREELRVVEQAARARELELQTAAEKQEAALQQRLDKTKRELMDVMSTNLNLDSRLRKAQEKLARAAAAAVASSSKGSNEGF